MRRPAVVIMLNELFRAHVHVGTHGTVIIEVDHLDCTEYSYE